MKQDRKFIFDLDGTLYRFACGSQTFGGSVFCADLFGRIEQFLAQRLDISEKEAKNIAAAINQKFDGEMSIGIEKTLGIDRFEYYAATWDCDPVGYVANDNRLASEMQRFTGNSVLLTAAPRAWADRVLAYLEIADVFGDNIITGEPDLRKPDPEVFHLAAQKLDTVPTNVVSIGDQNHSDILPAKTIGMQTVIIGPLLQDAHMRADDIYEAINLLKGFEK